MKSFLKDGEAESYRGVTVKYIAGRTAVMTIYDDQGNEKEKVELHTIKEKSLLHQLMKDKGFVQKSTEELAATMNEKDDSGSNRILRLGWSKLDQWTQSKHNKEQQAIKQRRMDEKEYLGETLPSYSSMFGFYGIALLSIGAMAQMARKRRHKRNLMIR